MTSLFFLICHCQLQVAKGQSVPSVASQTSFSKNVTPAPEWDHAPQPIAEQATVASDSFERSGSETVLEISAVEDEGQFLSSFACYALPMTFGWWSFA